MKIPMKKQIPLILAFAVVSAATAGGAVWYLKPQQSDKTETPAPVRENYKYVTLEKVIVMLRGEAGGPLSHYLSVDLVFRSTADKEKATKQQLPMLRSVAVNALSGYSFEKAGMMTMEQMTAVINHAYKQSYLRNPDAKTFSDVMIAKLIIE